MDEQEIQRLFEELQRALEEEAAQKRVLGRTSEATQKQIENLRDSIEDSGVSFKKLTDETNERAENEKKRGEKIEQAKKDLVQSFSGLAKTLAQGNATFKTFGSTISGITDAASSLSIVAGTLAAGPFGTAAGYITGLSIKTLGVAAEFAAEQLDKTLPIYQSLGSVGATTAKGFEGLLDQLDRTGGVSFPAFQNAVVKNSQGLAALGGTTAQGADRLSKTFGVLTNRNTELGRRMLSLGYGVDEIGERTANFIATQALFSGKQARSERDLASASAEYLEQLDRLARVTGASRQEQEEARRAAENDARFRAKINSMLRSGDEQQIEAAKNLQAVNEGLAKNPEAAAAFRASLTGIPLGEAAAGAFVGLQGAFTDVSRQIQAGAINADQGLQQIIKSSFDFQDRFGSLIQYGGEDLFGPITIAAFNLASMHQDNTKTIQAAKKEQDDLTSKTNKLTNRVVNLQLNLSNANNQVQRLGNELLEDTIPVLDSFGKGVAALADAAKNGVQGFDNFIDGSTSMLDRAKQYINDALSHFQPPAQSARPPAQTPQTPAQTATQPASVSPVMQQITADTLNQKLQDLVNIMGQSTVNQAQLTAAQQSMTSALGDYTASRPGESVQSVDDIMRNLKAARSQTQASGLGMSPDNLKLVLGSGSLPTFATGGITAGPSLAGEAGPEAVVPLPDGRSIPIQMPDYSSTLSTEFSNSTGAMMDRFEKTTQQMMNSFKQDANSENKEQLARLDASVTNLQQLVTLMKDQNSATNKLLQVSRN